MNDSSASIPGPSAAPARATLNVDANDPARFLNRDIEWLEFNARVLDIASDPRTPLLERLRFLSIYSANLDEFFMKRVGVLKRQIEAGVSGPVPEALTPQQQLDGIRARVATLGHRQAIVFRDRVMPALAPHAVRILRWEQLTEAQRAEAESWFRTSVFPILTPLAVDPGHRFPFISNMSVSLGVMLRRPGESEQLFARVKVPDIPSRLYRFAGTTEPGKITS